MKANGELLRIRRALQRHPELELAILFGSLAHDTFRHDSDIDLAVSAGSRLSATGRPVDLVDLTQAGEPLLGQILTTGVRLAGSGEAHARYLTRHLIEQADFVPYRDRILAEPKTGTENGDGFISHTRCRPEKQIRPRFRSTGWRRNQECIWSWIRVPATRTHHFARLSCRT